MGIGARVKTILSEKGMTVKQLSEVTGIPANTLYSITKRDEQSVRSDVLAKIAGVLGVGMGFLSDGKITTQRELDITRELFDGDLPATLEELEELAGGDAYLDISIATDEPYKPRSGDVTYYFSKMNEEGQAEYIRLGKILSKVPDYQRKGR